MFRNFKKSIELFRLKFTSSEIIGTEWQRCIDYVCFAGPPLRGAAVGGGRSRGARERDAELRAAVPPCHVLVYNIFFDVLMGSYVETWIV